MKFLLLKINEIKFLLLKRNEMKFLLLKRNYLDDRTLGKLFFYDPVELSFILYTLELVWDDNKKEKSCIPEGVYKALPHVSPNFGWSLWLQNVPNRTEILIHTGNFITDSLGCILPGLEWRDINGDGKLNVRSSREAIEMLKNNIDNDVLIKITNYEDADRRCY